MSLLPIVAPFGSFDPTNIANLEIWCRSDKGITLSGSDVTGWADQSGNGNNFADSGSGARPSYTTAASSSKFNSNAYLTFNGTSEYLDTGVMAVSQPFHVFMVLRQLSWTANEKILAMASAGSLTVEQNNSTPDIRHFAGSNVVHAVSPAINNDTLLQSFFNTTSSFQAIDNDASVSGSNPGSNDLTHVMIANRPSGSLFANIDVAEIAIYSAQITGSNLTSLKTYFNNRYSIW